MSFETAVSKAANMRELETSFREARRRRRKETLDRKFLFPERPAGHFDFGGDLCPPFHQSLSGLCRTRHPSIFWRRRVEPHLLFHSPIRDSFLDREQPDGHLWGSVIAVPLGVGCAAFISEMASKRFKEILKPAIEILAAIPSVVVGFLGIVLVNPIISKVFGVSHGLNALNGSILLAIMSLPTIVSLSEDALRAVPRTYKEASLALGANRWQTLVRVSIPSALSGIIASIMLGMGRAIGETMTVLMATGNAPALTFNFLEAIQTMTATIAIELGEVPYNTTHYYALFVIGFVLFVMTFVVNLISDLILQKYQEVER